MLGLLSACSLPLTCTDVHNAREGLNPQPGVRALLPPHVQPPGVRARKQVTLWFQSQAGL